MRDIDLTALSRLIMDIIIPVLVMVQLATTHGVVDGNCYSDDTTPFTERHLSAQTHPITHIHYKVQPAL